MTNEQKFKTPEERELAFRRYCAGTTCRDNCKCFNGVARCELAHKADAEGYRSVDVNDAIEWQRNHRKWLGEKEGGAA